MHLLDCFRKPRRVYRPLKKDHIRLLVLNGDRGTFIHSHVDKGTYETISYVWGDSTQRGSIIIDGEEIDIPASAEVVIRRVGQRTIWIDAVCINQDDLQERSAQVMMMSKIYKNGQKNLVWLGPSDEKTESALKSIAILAKQRQRSDARGIDWPAMYRYYTPLFTRIWIVQEVALSRQNIAMKGSYETPLEDVLGAAFAMAMVVQPHQPSPREQWHYIKSAVMHVILASEGNGILQQLLVILSGAMEATDPRDYVYGILGLWKGSITPDYTKCYADVWREASRLAIEEAGNLSILCYVWGGWVFNPRERRADWTHLKVFHATDRPLQLHKSEKHILAVSGFVVDTVERTASLIRGTVSDILDQLQHLESVVGDRIANVLLLGWTVENERIGPDASLATWQDFKTQVDQGVARENLWQRSTYFRAIYWKMSRRPVFWTTKGLIGAGVDLMQPGDIIAILYGCQWPAILRECSEGYKLIGVCFVDGIMEGELQGGPEVVFRLC